ncbi:uncharacterized protein METZ01_LOCUS247860, partial [marine metagenome]
MIQRIFHLQSRGDLTGGAMAMAYAVPEA